MGIRRWHSIHKHAARETRLPTDVKVLTVFAHVRLHYQAASSIEGEFVLLSKHVVKSCLYCVRQ